MTLNFTRMHSSRMRTARFSCRPGGVCVGVGMFAQGRVCWVGVGGSASGGVCLGIVHPPVNRMTDIQV